MPVAIQTATGFLRLMDRYIMINRLVSRTPYTFDADTLTALKLHLRIGHDELNSLLARELPVAVGIVENELGIACRSITWRYITDQPYNNTNQPNHLGTPFQNQFYLGVNGLPYFWLLQLPCQPVSSVTSIKAYQNGTQVALDSSTYTLTDDGQIKWIAYPTHDWRSDAITVEYVQAASPKTEEIQRAVFAVTCALIENPGDEVTTMNASSYSWLSRILNTLQEVSYV